VPVHVLAVGAVAVQQDQADDREYGEQRTADAEGEDPVGVRQADMRDGGDERQRGQGGEDAPNEYRHPDMS
jgi:hypothetical protein